MVGPRSKGCRVCVTSRVKCDELHPACSRCQRLRLECPGYQNCLIWHEVSTTDQRRSSNSRRSRDQLTQQQVKPQKLPIRHAGSQILRGDKHSRHAPMDISRCKSLTVVSVDQHDSMYWLINDMDPRLLYTRVWFEQIHKSNLTQVRMLEDSTKAIANAHAASKLKDNILVERSRKYYGQSLRALASSINPINHHYGEETATLQHTILALSMFELYDIGLTHQSQDLLLKDLAGHGYGVRKWRQHAKPLQHLLTKSGPAMYVDGSHRFVYLFMRDTLVSYYNQCPSP